MLNRGVRFQGLFKNPQYHPMPMETMGPVVFSGVNVFLDKIPVNPILEWESAFGRQIKNYLICACLCSVLGFFFFRCARCCVRRTPPKYQKGHALFSRSITCFLFCLLALFEVL